MNPSKTLSLLPVLVLAVVYLAGCSGLPHGCLVTSGCPGGGGGGGGATANLSFTLVADTLPANPSILSFNVMITGITVTSSTSTMTLTPPSTSFDLMRLQSDSAFLGTLPKVPSETISSLTVALKAQQLTFLNDTGVALTNPVCAINAICTFNPGTTASVLINNLNQAFSSNTGFQLDFNITNAITLSGTTLTVNFSNSGTTNVLTSFLLPRSNSNLASGQLDLIEDFTGVVSLSGSNVTITSATRGTLTTTTDSASFFDQSPPPTNLCPSAPSNCAAAGQIASVDAFLNSDGTISLKEFEPLNATQQDFIEGIVAVSPTNPTQFTIVATDKINAATNSVISTLNTGDVVTVNIPNLSQSFLVDSKGLALTNFASYSDFNGQTTTTAIHPGQTVALHLTAFTAASGTTLAVATADTVILRWSRLRANVFSRTTASITIDTLPSYFGFTSSTQEVVQAFFNSPLGTDGVTNLDVVGTDTSALTVGQPVGLRVLYFQNTTNTANPAFFAAKIRQP